MRCPIKMINPREHIHLSCDPDCALIACLEPREDEEGKWTTVEFCGLINLYSESPVLLKNGNITSVDIEEEEE